MIRINLGVCDFIFTQVWEIWEAFSTQCYRVFYQASREYMIDFWFMFYLMMSTADGQIMNTWKDKRLFSEINFGVKKTFLFLLPNNVVIQIK